MTGAKSRIDLTRRDAKRVRKTVRKFAKDAIRLRIAEHLFEARLLAPSNALVMAKMILDDVRPMIEAEIRHEIEKEASDAAS